MFNTESGASGLPHLPSSEAIHYCQQEVYICECMHACRDVRPSPSPPRQELEIQIVGQRDSNPMLGGGKRAKIKIKTRGNDGTDGRDITKKTKRRNTKSEDRKINLRRQRDAEDTELRI